MFLLTGISFDSFTGKRYHKNSNGSYYPANILLKIIQNCRALLEKNENMKISNILVTENDMDGKCSAFVLS